MKLRVGPREIELLMDGLIALGLNWEDYGHDAGITSRDIRRKEHLMDKLRELRRA